MIVYYLTFLEVLGCLSLSIALWDIPWVDFKAAYYEEVGIAATDHIKRAGHVLSVDTAGVQVPRYISAFHPYHRRSRPGIFMCLSEHRAVDELV